MIIADLNEIQGRTYPARRRTQNLVGGLSPVQAKNLSMGNVTLEPKGGQVPWHNQEQEEVYFIVEGRRRNVSRRGTPSCSNRPSRLHSFQSFSPADQYGRQTHENDLRLRPCRRCCPLETRAGGHPPQSRHRCSRPSGGCPTPVHKKTLTPKH